MQEMAKYGCAQAVSVCKHLSQHVKHCNVVAASAPVHLADAQQQTAVRLS